MQQRRRCKLAQLIMRKPQPCADYHRKDAHMNGMVIDIIIITLDVHDIAHDVSIAYHIIDHRLHRFAQLKLRFRRSLLPAYPCETDHIQFSVPASGLPG